MEEFSPSLWPVRPKPLTDELLSCWIMRLAHGLGLKAQTLCNVLWGASLQIWNRDIDRLGPEKVLTTLSAHTGVTFDDVLATTLRIFEGKVFGRCKDSGALPWIQSLKINHRMRDGFGMQFCGICLANDRIPYFRKRWRVSFYTVCTKHRVMLHDRCPACGSAVAFHRTDVGQGIGAMSDSLAACHVCGFNLANAPQISVTSYEAGASEWQYSLCASLERDCTGTSLFLGVDELRVLHHIIGLLWCRYRSVRLREYVCCQLAIPDLLKGHDREKIESASLAQRHFLVQLAGWLMIDLGPRLRKAWIGKTVRYNQLLKDLEQIPEFYGCAVAEASVGRRRRTSEMPVMSVRDRSVASS